MTALPSGQTLINQYASAIAGGAPPETAFAAAFGMTPSAFEPKLREYVHRMRFKAWNYTFDDRLHAQPPLTARALSPSEAEAWLGDLQVRIQRRDEGARRIEAAAAAQPDTAPVQLALARLRLAQDRADEAWPALERAVQLAPDDFDILYSTGVAALVHLDRASDQKRGDLEQRAFAALTRAAVLAPDSPDTLAWLAYAGLRQREWGAAADAIARAIALAPGRTEFRIRQADIMILRGAPNAARPMLQEIATRSADRLSADSARRRLEALDAAATRGNLAENTVAARGPLVGPARPASRTRLDLRRVQAGEEQAFGRLTAVECRVGQVRFHVEAGGRDVVSAAAQFADVDLVRFTDSKESRLGCGTRVAPDPVYVTWRVSKPRDWPADIAGVTVALEFLPPDYIPR